MKEIITFSDPSSARLDEYRRSEIEPVKIVNIMNGHEWVIEPVME